jgi:hypothetical protein
LKIKLYVVFEVGPSESTDVSEEYIASIFRVEEYVEQETSVRAGGRQSQPNTLVLGAVVEALCCKLEGGGFDSQ